MSRTRAGLDQKLSALQDKVSDMTPRRLTQRFMPEYFVDRMVGGVLMLVGLKLAWSRYREIKHRRERLQHELAGYGRWH